MATNGKAKTTYSIIYGDLPFEASDGVLTPVVIGPRYELHKFGDGYADAYLGKFVMESVRPDDYGLAGVKNLPAKQSDGKIDYTSVSMEARNAVIALHKGTISGTIDSTKGNVITTATDLDEDGNLIRPVAKGDYVYITTSGTGATTLPARVTKVTETYTYKTPTAKLVGASDETTCPFTLTAAATPLPAVIPQMSYVIRVQRVDSGSVSVEVRCLTNDRVFSGTVTSSSPLALGSNSPYSLSLKSGTPAATAGMTAIATYGEIDNIARKTLEVSTDLSQYSNKAVTCMFGGRTGYGVVTPISSDYWQLSGDCIELADEIRTIDDYAVAEAELYTPYRELIADYAGLPTLSTANNIREVVGDADPANPLGLAYAVYAKATNTYGPAGCFFVQIPEDTDEGYASVIDALEKYTDIYALVPLRTTPTTQTAVTNFVVDSSNVEVAEFKTAWLAANSKSVMDVYSVDGVSGFPLVASVNGTREITLTSGDAINGGVESGDTVTIHFGYDIASSQYSTQDFTVDYLKNKQTIVLTSATPTGVTGAFKVAISRRIDAATYADQLAQEAKNFNSHRVKLIASDTLNFDGFNDVDKVYAAVANATMRAALPPHAPLTDLKLPGFSVTEETRFSSRDLETMNAGGAWVLYTNIAGDVLNYHQITTVTNGKVCEEDSVVANTDSMIREIRSATKELNAGSSNSSDKLIKAIDGKIHAVMAAIASVAYPDKYGPRFESYEVKELVRSESNRQKIKCRTRIVTTLPLQDAEYEFAIM